MRTMGHRPLIVFLFGLSALCQPGFAAGPPDAESFERLQATQADIKRTALALEREIYEAGSGSSVAIPPSVRENRYGDALRHLSRRDYPDVIARLDAGRPADIGQAQARRLRAWLLADYGLPREAERAFQQASGSDIPAAVRAASSLHLAHSFYRRGAYGDVERVLARMPDVSSEVALSSARRTLQARTAMAQGRFGQAADILESLVAADGRDLYARYNLGVALLREGRPAGAAVLERLGRIEGADEEALALVDRANVTLGFVLLDQGKTSPAREAFERVRVEGPLSRRALLGLGWVEWQERNWRRSLVPWTKLQGMAPSDEAVIEAWSMLPEVLSALSSHARAADQFHAAADVISGEIRQLDRALIHYRGEGTVTSLLTAAQPAPPEPGGWSWNAARELPAASYLTSLLSSARLQAVVTDYRDLQAIDRLLERAQVVDATDMRRRIDALRPRIQDALHAHVRFVRQAVLDELESRRARLHEYLVRTRHALARLLDDMAHRGEG